MSFITAEDLEQLKHLRHTIHAHPEAAFEEKHTAQQVVNYLEACGVDKIHTQIGQTGVVASILGNQPGKTIAFRADMDALCMHEENNIEDVPYLSTKENRFHGCGHDGHTVMLLGAVKYLAKHRNFAGTIVFIFQPSEETLCGAKAMIADGLFDLYPIEEIYGLHNMPQLSKGKLHVNSKAALSASDHFEISIQGKGGHGAIPQLTIDPIVMAARLIGDIQTIVSRNISPFEPVAISFGSIHGGTVRNVIPDKVELTGTIRSYDQATRLIVHQRMKDITQSIGVGFGGKVNLIIHEGCPPLINNSELAQYTVAAFNDLTQSNDAFLSDLPYSPSEDFSYFLEKTKGVYSFIGQGNTPMCHHPLYNFDDDLISQGINYWIALAKARANYVV